MKLHTKMLSFPYRLKRTAVGHFWRAASPFKDCSDLPQDVRYPWLLLSASALLGVVFLCQLIANPVNPQAATPPRMPVGNRLVLVVAILILLEGCRRLLFRFLYQKSRNPATTKQTKGSVENFRNLSYVLTTAGGASLVMKLDGVFDLLVMLNVIVGFFYMDFLKPLYQTEQSEDSVSYLILKTHYATAMSKMVRVQLVLVAVALVWLVSGRWGA